MISEKDQKQQNHPESKIVKQELVHEGKWLRFLHLDFSIGNKVVKNYEACERTTRKNREFDGVTILGIIKSSQKPPQMLLIAQFRPPVQKFVLELPAGLIEGDNYFEEAQRELQEETGYKAKKLIQYIDVKNQPISCGDPSALNSTGKMLMVEIDGDEECNKNPKQELEDSENIRVHVLEINKDLLQNITNLAQQNDYMVIDKVWSFATGLTVALDFKI